MLTTTQGTHPAREIAQKWESLQHTYTCKTLRIKRASQSPFLFSKLCVVSVIIFSFIVLFMHTSVVCIYLKQLTLYVHRFSTNLKVL